MSVHDFLGIMLVVSSLGLVGGCTQEQEAEVEASQVEDMRDSVRRGRVLEMLDSNDIRTSEDYRHAAMVFQHGSDTVAARIAHDLAQKGVELDSRNSDAKWLKAASWDRYQMRLGQPQWYGTQYVRDSDDSPWRLYDIDTTAVSDQERLRLGVPTLAEARARVKK